MAKKKELIEEKAEKKSGAKGAKKEERAHEKPKKAEKPEPKAKVRAVPKTEAQEKRDALKRELEERGIRVKEIAAEALEKGKFSSERKTSERKAPEWVEYKPRQIEQLIVQMANSGHTGSEIGMLLRDQYGIPNVETVTKKSMLKMLQENNIAPKMPEDLMNLIKKSLKLHKHMQLNRKDMSAKHGYVLTVSKIRKLSNYYQRMGRLAKDWRYSTEEAELLMK
ncbi:MAG: 30S ribosomal protein S15 [Candidatus Diapherotrites archaeon]|nr:30S ribosomal protein S15 [Candidatus Diapherotrites archaeon]